MSARVSSKNTKTVKNYIMQEMWLNHSNKVYGNDTECRKNMNEVKNLQIVLDNPGGW